MEQRLCDRLPRGKGCPYLTCNSDPGNSGIIAVYTVNLLHERLYDIINGSLNDIDTEAIYAAYYDFDADNDLTLEGTTLVNVKGGDGQDKLFTIMKRAESTKSAIGMRKANRVMTKHRMGKSGCVEICSFINSPPVSGDLRGQNLEEIFFNGIVPRECVIFSELPFDHSNAAPKGTVGFFCCSEKLKEMVDLLFRDGIIEAVSNEDWDGAVRITSSSELDDFLNKRKTG